ncbi:GntR family transcriptional regulator [Alicyclobacillus fastidiosus]|uniref:GntR family transcriptional regulator n=1 Tax=Alicyclobacillus fastidiosus TaxID=392011 RepID=A0ABY6ZJP0_9BACL|nr:GntR family transcriptional regulator [Alicyclobacillus fastidiosus]WAH43062.1 GntR family transcriptional regulator [Alicyclobacillus fastidiosus]GMA65048.1 GntR family transcriptional regulator [Alicyclobacillus fastidiosus]
MDKYQVGTQAVEMLNHNSPIPLHYQLTEILRRNILNGDLIDNDGKVPTEAELGKKFQVSRITVRTAIDALVSEGLLWRKRGSGTFLKTNKVENWVGQLMGFSETIQEAGYEARGRVLSTRTVNTKDIQDQLPETVDGVERLWELKRLRYADEKPIAIEQSFFSEDIGRVIQRQDDLDNVLTYRFIESEMQIPLSEATQMITAINANSEDADMLAVEKRAALLYIERVTKSKDGRFIEFLRAKYRPDYFNYVIQLTRRAER